MSFINKKLDQYIENHSTAEPPLQQELRREAHVHLLQSRMLSGHLQGRLLKILVASTRPRNVLEIGTYSGYTTLCLAEGMESMEQIKQLSRRGGGESISGGKVHTIEACDERQDFIEQSFARTPLASKIVLHIGAAEEILPSLLQEVPFDFVYIDANKRHYLHYYRLLIEVLPSGTLIAADNTLWDGKVIAEPLPQDAQTKGILAFNKVVARDPRVEVVLLPIRDGLSLIYKK